MPSLNAPSRRRSWLIPVVVVAVAAALLVVSLLASRERSAVEGAPAGDSAVVDGPVAKVEEPEQPPLPDMARRDPEDPMAVGPADAPVALIVYSDFQCPFCASWSAATQPTMLEHADEGTLRVEFRDINAFGPVSQQAAQAAYAASLQGKYLEYHDALFEGGEKRPAEELSAEALTAVAAEVGLDVERFEADLASPEVAAAVQANIDEATSLGIFSTPAFLLGDTPILGAQPTEVFEEAFQDELSKSED